jgi:hypothetical protein
MILDSIFPEGLKKGASSQLIEDFKTNPQEALKQLISNV